MDLIPIFPLGDDIGSIELIDFMGNDLTVVNAARVSMNKSKDAFSLSDAKLIRYLAKHGHWTPFSQVMLQFRIKMPIFLARQWFKHQIGITRNEVSRRYVTEAPEFYEPTVLRRQSPDIKQGSTSESVAHEERCRGAMEFSIGVAASVYEDLINSGVCAEQARGVLPQSMYTEFVETGSLAAYARVFSQRSDSHAQSEIQQYANALGVFCASVAPTSWEALTKQEQTDVN